ncbi:MAG: hypothetical protein AAGM22_14765 [Acidobacteriota bacterium]
MGLSAEVIAIGGFRGELVPHLSQDPERYRGTRDGAVIVESLFNDYGSRGSRASRELAATLAVQVWDFSTHPLQLGRVDLPALEALVGRREVERFESFAAAGFRFFFRPDG